MQAIIHTQYGSPDLLQLQDVEKPTPAADQVLIRVHASSVNYADLHIVLGDPKLVRLASGLRKPKMPIPGADVAGVVEAVGATVTEFKVGDAVYADLSNNGMGGYAEYVCAVVKVVAPKPATISFEAAAAIPLAAGTALQAVRDHGMVKAGDKVLVTGATGGVGSFIVQIAKVLGATVTAVGSTPKLDMLRQIGADEVIDYTTTDITQSGRQFDAIFDAAAYRTYPNYAPILAPTGRYVMVGGGMKQIFGAMGRSIFNKRVKSFVAKVNAADLVALNDWLATGAIKPYIDRTFALADVPAALQYMADRKVCGKVVITVA